MKRFLTILFAGLLIVAITAPAIAWEFSMKGEYEYRFRYFGRAGATDLYGNANLQETPSAWGAAVNVGFAGPNIYNTGNPPSVPYNTAVPSAVGATFLDAGNAGGGTPGGYPSMKIVRGGFSKWGSDALYSDSRLTFYPEVRVNPAIRVHGVYTVGGYRHKYFQAYTGGGAASLIPAFNGTPGTPVDQSLPPFERYYMSQTSMNAYDTAAVGSWEQFRATVQLPIGIWSFGVKDFPWGTGASLGNNTRAEAFLTVVPYGPFRLLHGIWLSRGVLGSPHESWFTGVDKDAKWNFFQGFLVNYDTADFSMGLGTILQLGHLNRAQVVAAGQQGVAVAPNMQAIDLDAWINLAFFKYNNGRFFANAEYAWANVNLICPGGIKPVGAPTFGQQYREVYHWFSEAGVMAGPSKVTFLYALASGLVQNNPNPTKSYRSWAINYQAMQPYQFLMFDTYAGGNNGGWSSTDVTFVSDEHGMMTDAYAFAARLDYATASNLNVWGSYIWAHRLERAGYFAGAFTPTGAGANTTAAGAQAWKARVLGGTAANYNPYVDDGYIGWEANAGVDWKLLEGMTATFRYSYWQPGDWFTQAYKSVGTLSTGAFDDATIVQGRDAIQAFQGTIMIDF